LANTALRKGTMNANSAHFSATDSLARLRKTFERWRIPAVFLDGLTDRKIAVSFPKDATIFARGSTPESIGCVLSGYVRVYCPVGDGNRTLMRIVCPGELLGYSDFIDNRGRRARRFESQSLTKCNVALLSRAHIVRTLRTLHPDTLVDLIESLNTYLSETTHWFALLLGLPLQQRIEMVFDDLGMRAGVRDARGVFLLPEICQEDLAQMIGCSRPAVTRLVRDLEKSGRLARRGKQYILLSDWDQEPARERASWNPFAPTCGATLRMRVRSAAGSGSV
jgi:CRP-like cAMP-binding protein